MTPERPDPASSPERPDPASFLSGDAGDVTDPWRRAKRTAGELAFDAIDTLAGTRRAAARLAQKTPSRDILVTGVHRPGSQLAAALPALHSATHNVRLAFGATGARDASLEAHTVAGDLTGGKFENLNRVLAAAPTVGADWLLVVDDDVRLPGAFLDRFVGVCEAFGLDLAQPAQTLRSHSAWKVTRRRPASLVRETRFVEIGPVTAFSRRAAAELLPFPELRYGWGLDLHWAAVAGRRGWRLGVVDAVPVRHETGIVGASYSRSEAESEAASFLAEREYLPSARAGEVLATHRRASG
ncbi:MAG TPA: hypothetical protein VE526_00665 [Solirubrobacteraceae bacterium]|jgi:hypothetical protein|nr:hypothetical protein [Solirubrobacteraceae bacterium]